MMKAVFYPMIHVCFRVSGRYFDGYAAISATNTRNGIAHENFTTGTGNQTLDTGLESNVSSQTCSRRMKSRDLCIIKETVAIIEPEIEESESQNQPAMEMFKKKNNSQPNLQVILEMPYGSFLGHESPKNVMSKSQPNLQVTVSMSDCTFGDTSVNEKSTSTSDLELNEFNDDTWSSCSAGTNSSCGSSFREDCPHCLIQSKSSDSFDKNVMEVFV